VNAMNTWKYMQTAKNNLNMLYWKFL
jgi:hypothetical protein